MKTGLFSDYTNSTLSIFGDNLRKQVEKNITFTQEQISMMASVGKIGYAVQEIRDKARTTNQEIDAQIESLRKQGLTNEDIVAMGYVDKYAASKSNVASERSLLVAQKIAKLEKQKLTFLETEELYNINGVTQLRTRAEMLDELNSKRARGEELTESELALEKQIREELNGISDSVTVVNQVRDAFMETFNAETYNDTFNNFGSRIQQMLKDKVLNNLIDGQFAEQINTLINQATNAINTGDLTGFKIVQNSIMAISAQSQLAQQQLSGLISMFDSSKIIDYTDKSREINFSAASTKDITYAVTNNVSLSAGALIGMDSVGMQKLATALVPHIEKAFQNVGKPIT